VLDRAVVEVDFPTATHLEGATTPEDRIRRFVAVTFRFFERSSDWWRVFSGDPELPAVKAREHVYLEAFAGFHGAAFGELAGDRVMAAAVRAFVDYGPWHALGAAGLSLDESIDVVADALVNVARQRAGAQEGGR
jgi:hypothetical protein